ncbi:unnamed protein product [Candidula unifasciata]|uniref:Uncharacterized protein n=1 Tax=Candidula unifasciata TaxID=100452 RepID=A0A8S3ZSN7_9EUPU|nr:unnamed protein product [Candidula unifasciata]
MEEEQSKNQFLPKIPVKSPWSSYSYTKAIQESPYKALVGVVIDGRDPERHPEYSRYRIRKQTGLTNRWRLPHSLYSDLLGTAQALKAVNMPFNQNLVSTLSRTYPSMNPMLLTCQDYNDMNEKNWSLLKKSTIQKRTTEDEDHENPMPPV